MDTPVQVVGHPYYTGCQTTKPFKQGKRELNTKGNYRTGGRGKGIGAVLARICGEEAAESEGRNGFGSIMARI
jgi:hypothetical protein